MLEFLQGSRDRKWVFPVYNRSFQSWAKEEGNGREGGGEKGSCREIARTRSLTFGSHANSLRADSHFSCTELVRSFVRSFTRDSRNWEILHEGVPNCWGIRFYHVGGNTPTTSVKPVVSHEAFSASSCLPPDRSGCVVCFILALVDRSRDSTVIHQWWRTTSFRR